MLDPNFHPFPELVTERLLLRRLELEDAPEIFFLRSDEKILEFVHKEPAASVKEAEDFIQFIHEAIDANHTIMWGIALNNDPGTLIGTICFWNIRRNDHRAEVGYVLHPAYWRKGIMRETLSAVINYGFEKMLLNSIDAIIDSRNTSSARILEAVGFVREGLLRQNTVFRNQLLDTAIYSRLKNQL